MCGRLVKPYRSADAQLSYAEVAHVREAAHAEGVRGDRPRAYRALELLRLFTRVPLRARIADVGVLEDPVARIGGAALGTRPLCCSKLHLPALVALLHLGELDFCNEMLQEFEQSLLLQRAARSRSQRTWRSPNFLQRALKEGIVFLPNGRRWGL